MKTTLKVTTVRFDTTEDGEEQLVVEDYHLTKRKVVVIRLGPTGAEEVLMALHRLLTRRQEKVTSLANLFMRKEK